MTIADADREAAQALAMTLFDGEFNPDKIAHTFRQAFARHRELGIEQAAAWLDTYDPQMAEAIRRALIGETK